MTEHAVSLRAESRAMPLALLSGVVALVAAAWVVLIARMAGMYDGPGGDPGALGWFAATWAVMTVAMMLPASAPAAVHPARVWRTRAPAAAALFLAGYVAVWMLAGLVGYALVVAVRGMHLGVLGWSSAGRYLAAATVVTAGLYQLTRSKRRSLERCVAPEAPCGGEAGVAAALRLGIKHGGSCIACCWVLMTALYALGMMSVTWMVVLTAVIVGERLLPRPLLAARAAAVVLVVLGLAVAAAPSAVPGFTVPSQAHAMTMKGMWMPMGGGMPMSKGGGSTMPMAGGS